MDVGCNLCGFGASTMTYNITRAQPYINFLKIYPHLHKCNIHPHLHKCNNVRVDSYPHPQLIKVLKHFIYI